MSADERIAELETALREAREERNQARELERKLRVELEHVSKELDQARDAFYSDREQVRELLRRAAPHVSATNWPVLRGAIEAVLSPSPE